MSKENRDSKISEIGNKRTFQKEKCRYWLWKLNEINVILNPAGGPEGTVGKWPRVQYRLKQYKKLAERHGGLHETIQNTSIRILKRDTKENQFMAIFNDIMDDNFSELKRKWNITL